MINRMQIIMASLLLTAACGQGGEPAEAAVSSQGALEYEVMGSVTARIDGNEHEFCIPYLSEEDEAYAELIGPVPSMKSLLITGFTCTGGDLDEPRLDLAVARPGPNAAGTDLQFHREGTVYMAEEAMGSLEVTNVEVSDQRITLQFDAEAVAVELDGFEYLPKEGMEPVVLTGSVDVELRP